MCFIRVGSCSGLEISVIVKTQVKLMYLIIKSAFTWQLSQTQIKQDQENMATTEKKSMIIQEPIMQVGLYSPYCVVASWGCGFESQPWTLMCVRLRAQNKRHVLRKPMCI